MRVKSSSDWLIIQKKYNLSGLILPNNWNIKLKKNILEINLYFILLNNMKKKIKLSAGITLINKKFKKNQHYHYFSEPNNSLIIPILNKKF